VKHCARRILCSASVLIAANFLAGCGFHFAGQEPLPEPLKSVYVEVIDPFHVTVPPVETGLQSRITRSGGVVKSKAADATSVLRLTNLQETQEVLSLGPDGKAIEYRLVSRVTYELHSGNRVLIPPQAQGLDRTYSFSATQILPKEAEATRLSHYVQDDLAEVILLRIQSQLRRHPDGIAEDEAPDDAAATETVAPQTAGAVTSSAAAPSASTGAAPAP